MGQSTGQLHSLHSPGCPRRRQLATGPLHRHFQTADAKSGRSERPRLKPLPQVSDRHCFSDTSIHIQQDQLHLARSPRGGPGRRIWGVSPSVLICGRRSPEEDQRKASRLCCCSGQSERQFDWRMIDMKLAALWKVLSDNTSAMRLS